MSRKKLKGMPIIMAAIIACAILLYGKNSDFYSVQYGGSDFRQVYLEEYSGDNSELLYYVNKGDDTVKCFTKGPISIESVGNDTTYKLDAQYSAKNDTTIFKVFAADYISADNSGGKVFVKERLNPENSAISTSFVLDQSVDSLFITFETEDENFSIGHVNMNSNKAVFTDTYVMMVIVLFLSALLLFFINRKYPEEREFFIGEKAFGYDKYVMLFILIATVTVVMTSLPVLDGGIIYGHDIEFHMARIEGIARGLSSGQFPVRIHGGTLNDYGYPNSLFYPELLLYIPAILRLIGVSVYAAYKFYIIEINVLGFIACYLPFKKFTHSRPLALMMTATYMLLPGRLVNAFYRCAIGEFTAMTFLPLVVYGLYAIMYGNKKDWKYLVVGATMVLQSHILSTEITALFACTFALIGIKQLFNKERRIVPLILAAMSTVFINIWFLVPMILMMIQLKLMVFMRPSVSAGFASTDISYLFSIGKIDTATLKGPYGIGFTVLLGVVVYCILRILHEDDENKSKHFACADNMLVNIGLFVFASTAFFPWEKIGSIPLIGNIINSVQFPHRLNGITMVLGVFLIGYAAILLCKNSKHRVAFSAVFICVSMFSSIFVIDQIVGIGRSEMQSKSYYRNNMDNQLSVGQAEYLLEGNNLDYMVANPPVLESENDTMSIENFTHWGTKMSFDYSMDLSGDNSNVIVLPVTYIPNYVIMIDGQRIYPFVTDGARVAFSVPAETGSVTVHYSEPLTFRACEVVSLVSLMAFIFISTSKGKQLLSKLKKN